jgi:hypothetical protein
VAGSDLNPAVAPGDTWVYFGSGLDQGGGVETTVDGLLVGAGGEFAMAPQAVSDMKQRAGYVYAAVSDFLYALGGFGGGPDSGGESAQICPGGFEPQCSGPAPETKNWNALGTGALLVPRYLPGSAQESSVIFAVGGDDGSGATTSVEYTNF